jgi:hypothetical protein
MKLAINKPTPAQASVLMEMARGSEVYFQRNEWRTIGPRWVNGRAKSRAGTIRAATWRALIGLDYVQLQDATGSKWTLTEAGIQAAGGINPEDLLREPKGMTSHDVLKSLRKLWPTMPMSVEVAVGPTGNPSYADAVFLMGSEGMTAVEVKVSRGDWLAELKDPMKRVPIVAMSARFYFATPAGMTLPSELPEGCGLIEIEPRSLRASVTTGAALRYPSKPDWLLMMRIGSGMERAASLGL